MGTIKMDGGSPGSFRSPSSSFWLIVVLGVIIYFLWELHGLVDLW